MKRTKPNEKMKKLVDRLVGAVPGFASVAPLFLYHNDDLLGLETLAAILNDVAPHSPGHAIAELIEKLVTTPPAQQEWVRHAPIIGPTLCDPAPGSPCMCSTNFCRSTLCVLRIAGIERAQGTIEVCPDHLPLPLHRAVGMSDKAIQNRATDGVLWILWEVFYRDTDLTRLKSCSICHRWFVDRTKNKSKTLCSARCTSQRWSWEARKQAGHVQKRKSAGIDSGHDLTGSKRNVKGASRAKAKKA